MRAVDQYTIHFLWSWLPMVGTTLATKRHVWLKGSAGPTALGHELIHLAQAREMGSIRFALRWLFSPNWRKHLEAQAYAQSVKLGGSLAVCAKSLSGPLYLWCCSREDAEGLIRSYLERLP